MNDQVAVRIAGVWLSKVKETVVDLYAARAGLKPEPRATLQEKVRLLADHYRNTLKKKDLAICDICAGESHASIDCCPFCGAEGGVDDEEPLVIETVAEVASADLPSNVRQIEFGRRSAKAIAKKQEPAAAESDLERNVRDILRLKAAAAVSLWELGCALLENQERQLWKERIREDGKPAFSTFKQFLVSEVGLTPNYAVKLIEVTRTFGKALVDKIGINKLGVILQLPPEMRVPLVDAANAGATKRELEELAEAAKEDALPPKPDPKMVTLALTLRKVVVPLLKKGGKKPASDLAPGVWGEEELPNGVVCRYSLVKNKKTGDFELHLERRRGGE